MIRLISAFLLMQLTATGALLPEALGEFERGTASAFQPPEKDVFAEFGMEEGEKARFATAAGQSVEIFAVRFGDATGAFAAFHWLQPAQGEEMPFGERAIQNGESTLIHFGNYVIRMDGSFPLEDHVELMLAYLPRVQITAAPPLLSYFPADQLIPNSTRHVLGPVVLEKLTPEIAPSVAAFHFGSEAHYGRYATPSGEHQMLLFSYPTPQISRRQVEEFNKLPNVVAKRDGPLIAVVVAPKSADEAQRLLARVRYAAEVTLHHREPGRHENLGNLILDIVIFCGILMVLMIVGGTIVAGARLAAGRFAPNSIITPPAELEVVKMDIERR